METKEIIEALSALSKVVEANKGILGNENNSREANRLIGMLLYELLVKIPTHQI